MNIADILAPDRIVIGASLTSKKSVLEKLSGMLSSADAALNAQSVFDSLLARERLGTTGLGAGIAIPHGRVASGGRSIGAFLRIDRGIDFDAVDNRPVDLFFALCVPQEATDEHLQLLAELATKLSDPRVVSALRDAGSAEEVYRELATASEAPD